jgi:hypothetical protein
MLTSAAGFGVLRLSEANERSADERSDIRDGYRFSPYLAAIMRTTC